MVAEFSIQTTEPQAMLARPIRKILVFILVILTVGGCAAGPQMVDPASCLPDQCCSQGIPVACLWNLRCYGYHPTEWRRWPLECEPPSAQVCPLPAPGQPPSCPPTLPEQALPAVPPPPPPMAPTEAMPPPEIAPQPANETQSQEGSPGILREPARTPLPPPSPPEEEVPSAPVPPTPAFPKSSAPSGPAPQALLKVEPPKILGKPAETSKEEKKGQLEPPSVRLLSLDTEAAEELPLAPLPDEILVPNPTH